MSLLENSIELKRLPQIFSLKSTESKTKIFKVGFLREVIQKTTNIFNETVEVFIILKLFFDEI